MSKRATSLYTLYFTLLYFIIHKITHWHGNPGPAHGFSSDKRYFMQKEKIQKTYFCLNLCFFTSGKMNFAIFSLVKQL